MIVTPYSDKEIYPAGLYINQHPGFADFGLQEWVNRDEPIENEDLVMWPCGFQIFLRVG
jgi:primary-amine oxidase